MVTVTPLDSPSGPPAKGPYVPAVRAGGWIVLAGQGAIDPLTGKVVPGSVGSQTRLTLQNIAAILSDHGASLGDIAKVTVYLTSVADFDEMNDVYAEAFGAHRPARTTVGVAELPFDLLVEIEVWARAPEAPQV